MPIGLVVCQFSGAATGTSTTLAQHGYQGQKPTSLCEREGGLMTPIELAISRRKAAIDEAKPTRTYHVDADADLLCSLSEGVPPVVEGW